jgi:hypothetical protein
MVLGELGGGEGENGGVGGSAGGASTSQRITPYLSKVAPRPATPAAEHTPTTGGRFAERQNAGATLTSLNPQLEVPAAGGEESAMEVDGGVGGGSGPRCRIEVLGRPMRWSDKFMADRLEDKVGSRAWLAGCG